MILGNGIITREAHDNEHKVIVQEVSYGERMRVQTHINFETWPAHDTFENVCKKHGLDEKDLCYFCVIDKRGEREKLMTMTQDGKAAKALVTILGKTDGRLIRVTLREKLVYVGNCIKVIPKSETEN